MTIHLVKLCVGWDSFEDLATWQSGRLKQMKADGIKPELFHRTFQSPKRREELLNGGSLYWVIKGIVLVRQRLLDLREGVKDDGTPCCLLMLFPVRPCRVAPSRAGAISQRMRHRKTWQAASPTASPRCRPSSGRSWLSWA